MLGKVKVGCYVFCCARTDVGCEVNARRHRSVLRAFTAFTYCAQKIRTFRAGRSNASARAHDNLLRRKRS
jgi:hypothetical protein